MRHRASGGLLWVLIGLGAVGVAAAEPTYPEVIVLPERPTPTPAPVPLERLIVTGTHIPRVDLEDTQPVLRIERAELSRSGARSVAEFLGQLAFTGSASNPTAPNAEEGGQNVNLRGIGAERTLVLLNGRRLGGGLFFFNTTASDLSLIPLSAIERIDVLKDGASAVYGSDALAGVINIITRRGLERPEARARIGAYEQGDGLSRDLGLSFGSPAGGTEWFLDLSYSEQDAVRRVDRALTRFPVFGTGTTRGSDVTPRGTLVFVPTPANALLLGPERCPGLPGGPPLCSIVLRPGETITGAVGENTATVAGRYEPFNTTSLDPAVNDLYNDNEVIGLSYPDRRLSLFGTLSQAFAGGGGLQAELLYTHRELRQPFPAGVFFGDFIGERFAEVFVAADNVFNPFDQDIGRGDPNIGIGSGTVLRNLVEVSAPGSAVRIDAVRLGLAVDGRLADFGWDLGLVYGMSRSDAEFRSGVNLDHLALALGPAEDCASTPGCVPLNIFGGPGSITPEMLDYVTYLTTYPKQQSLALAYGKINGALAALPAGLLEVAAGLEYRRERYADEPDALIVSCRSLGCFPPTDGRFAVAEAFAELRIPLLSDRRFARALDLSLALRHSDYDAFGPATNYKLGLAWTPNADLLLRASGSTAFRAPSISDSFLSSASFLLFVTDPCSDYAGANGGPPASPTVQDNCRAFGVPESYVQQGPVPGRDGGNPDLEPETAVTFNLGAVYSPRALPGLTVSADWYRIELEDVILLLGSQLGLDACYGTPGGGQTCALVSRDQASGAIRELRLVPLNLGGGTIQGADLTLNYALPAFRWGEVALQLQAGYLDQVTAEILNTDGTQQEILFQGTSGLAGAFPRLRANAVLSWTRGPLSASWSSRYLHRQTEPCFDGIEPSFTALGLCSQPNAEDPSQSKNELPAVLYHDVQFGYTLPGSKNRLSLGVRNLLDKDPPPSYASPAYDGTTYEAPGRYGYLGIDLAF